MALLRIIEAKDTSRVLARQVTDDVELPDAVRSGIRRIFGEELTAGQVVDRVLARVRSEGDKALLDLTRALDGVSLERLEITPQQTREAYGLVPPDLVKAMRLSAEQIQAFHQKQKQQGWVDFSPAGAVGQIVRPLRSVGIYAPGGRAPYPSTVLMAAVPARVAGVEEIVVVSPPSGQQGISPLVLVAADIAGASRIFALGGAQAIAALAYGTESVPRVDKILGPGNIFVTLAKKKVFGLVGIDQLAGPTETLVVADDSARPELVAADLLAQAEHDPMASAILVTTSSALVDKVQSELERQLANLSRCHIARESLARNGVAVLADTLAEAIEVANQYAPEHLCLLVQDPWPLVGLIRNAGGVFVGENSPEVMGDYVAGPSHVMPTGGTARFYSPLNLLDFVKVISLVALSESQMRALGPAAAALAQAEGLTAHAAAVEARLKVKPRTTLGGALVEPGEERP